MSRPGGWRAAGAAALLAAGVVVAPARPALATNVGCMGTPALGDIVECAGPSHYTNIEVPAGATAVWVEVIGAGGGGSVAGATPAAGGPGGVVEGWLPLGGTVTDLILRIGGGGAGGAAGNGLSAGGGGAGSHIIAAEPYGVYFNTLVVAGGGGGAGGSDQTSLSTGAGGAAGGFTNPGTGQDGEPAGIVNSIADPGQGGQPGVGGSGGVNGGDPTGNGTAGGSMSVYNDPRAQLGGVGGSLGGFPRGGGGGGGHGGGGGGAAVSLGGSDYAGGGGGGGSSWAEPVAYPDMTFSLAAPGGPGHSGAGAPQSGGQAAEAGGDGQVKLKFATVIPPAIASVSPASALRTAGGTLTVTGRRLTGATAVKVDNKDCPITSTTATEVECTLPVGDGAGPVDVELTTPDGTATKSGAFTYTAAPAISTVAPAAGPKAGGTSLTISGTALTGVTVEVGGVPCPVAPGANDTSVTCTTAGGAPGAALGVTVTNGVGSDTRNSAFTYLDPPSISSVSPTSGTLGGGDTLVVTGTALDTTTAIKVDGEACPGTGAQHAYTATSVSVSCVVPAAVNGVGNRDVEVTTLGGSDTRTGGYRYSGPPVIASVLPTAGPQAGGNSMTILGDDLGGVAWVRVGGQLCASLSPTASTVTCVVPSAATPGVVDVVASAAAGVDVKPSAYEYRPRPVPPPVVVPQPVPTPTTSPTSAPPTGAPPARPELKLDLAIQPGAPVRGAAASVSGGGLRANSQYTVTMYSSPVRLASGYADETGSFTARFKLPARACVKGGLHRVELSGFAPDGTVVTTSTWLLFDDTCTTRTVSPAKPTAVTYGTFRFDRGSVRLTPYVRAVMRRTHATLASAKRVTITGYTETGSRSEASKRANKALALRRAQAARDYLRKLGVKAPITVLGAGAVNPLKGRPQSWNRRVFITVRY